MLYFPPEIITSHHDKPGSASSSPKVSVSIRPHFGLQTNTMSAAFPSTLNILKPWSSVDTRCKQSTSSDSQHMYERGWSPVAVLVQTLHQTRVQLIIQHTAPKTTSHTYFTSYQRPGNRPTPSVLGVRGHPSQDPWRNSQINSSYMTAKAKFALTLEEEIYRFSWSLKEKNEQT